jgi:hypothetical protein
MTIGLRAIPIGGLIAACAAAAADSDSGPIGPRRFEVVALSQPAVLAIDKKDVDQGFVDLPNASSFELRGNGNFVVSTSNAPYISVVRVHVSAAEETAAQRRFIQSYRIFLSPAARIGVHPWPIGIKSSIH